MPAIGPVLAFRAGIPFFPQQGLRATDTGAGVLFSFLLLLLCTDRSLGLEAFAALPLPCFPSALPLPPFCVVSLRVMLAGLLGPFVGPLLIVSDSLQLCAPVNPT